MTTLPVSDAAPANEDASLAVLEEAVRQLIRREVSARQDVRKANHAASTELEAFCLELLKVADMLDHQVAFLEKQGTEGPWKRLARNMGLARNTLLEALEGRGIHRIDPAVGGPPDYRMSRAVERRPDPDAAGETVDEVLQAGYVRGEAVLRMAEIAVRLPEA